MFANINFGKDITQVLRYNEQKLKRGDAYVLMAGGFPGDIQQLSFERKQLRFQKRIRLNTRAGKLALHISLNFHPDDELYRIKLQRITLDYLRKIGFGHHPFIAYQHLDAGHPHLHIVSTPVDLEGKRRSVHPRFLGKAVTTELERDYGLRPLIPYNPVRHQIMPPEQLQRVIYGRFATKPAICQVVESVVTAYKFTSLTELNAALRCYNVTAGAGKPLSWLNKMKGLYYHVLNNNGRPIGKPIKASSIYGQPTRIHLQRLYLHKERERRPYAVRIRYLLDEALKYPALTDGLKLLQKHQIQLMFYQDFSGRLQGLAYVDRATHVVFNSKSLGPDYSVQRILSLLIGTGEAADAATRTMQQSRQTHHPTRHAQLQEVQKDFPGVVLQMTDYGASEQQSVALQQNKSQKQQRHLHL